MIAPDFPTEGVTWFNVAEPMTLASLRGRVVLLDFWSYCCINCLHLLATLQRIEQLFPNEVAVIGIHSPKFPAEKEDKNLQDAIARYGITHPVIQDREIRLWKAYGVRAWPTLAVISPGGRLLNLIPGEANFEKLVRFLQQLIHQGKVLGSFKPALLPLIAPSFPPAALAFPGKIRPLPCEYGFKRWVVADSGHHQVVILGDDGREIARYGAGQAGCQDGEKDAALFRSPQGVVANCDEIFVADTGNHVIRRIDLRAGYVERVAGTGERGGVLRYPQPAHTTALASVWDLELADDHLYFANAGTHQLGLLDLEYGMVKPLAGTGGEGLRDGPALTAMLAQPSGLALDRQRRHLYFVDSENSAVRCLHLAEEEVETLAGQGLFSFGHINGSVRQALFQHPLGLALLDHDRLLIADSYNQTIRWIDLIHGQVGDLATHGFMCQDPLCLPLAEPAGIIADGLDRLLVSDTNNHRLVEYHLSAAQSRTFFPR